MDIFKSRTSRDPDSRAMVIPGQVIEVALNVQTVVDVKHNLVVEYLATNRNDKKALLPMALSVKKIFGKKSTTVLADKGYHNGEQLSACEQENVIYLTSGNAG